MSSQNFCMGDLADSIPSHKERKACTLGDTWDNCSVAVAGVAVKTFMFCISKWSVSLSATAKESAIMTEMVDCTSLSNPSSTFVAKT